MERFAIGAILTLYLGLLIFGMKNNKKVDKYICKCKVGMGCGDMCCVSCIGYPECFRNCGGDPSTCGKAEVIDHIKYGRG